MNTNATTKKDRLNKAIAYLKGMQIVKTQKEIAQKLNIDSGNFSKAKNGDSDYLTDHFLSKFSETFDMFSYSWLLNGSGEMTEDAEAEHRETITTKNGLEYIELDNGMFLMRVPLFEIPAQASFVDNYQDLEYLSEIHDYHTIIVDKVHLGRYFAFRVRNDSMDSGDSDSILPNDIVTVRELQRIHWKDKLRYQQRPYWIIATTQSTYPLLKKIVDHDTSKGIITCHSLNDAPEYSDFELSLNDVTGLFYVVDINRRM